MTVPKFKVPFEIRGTSAAIVEQDSSDEITQCVEAVLKTVVGTRDDRPEYGIPDVAFTQPDHPAGSTPAPTTAAIRRAIQRWEPRAETSLVDEVVGRVRTIHVNVESEA